MRRSTYVEFNKIEKPLPPHPKTAQGGYVNDFVSLRRLNGRFCGPEKKSKFGSRLRELKMTFSFLIFFLGLTNGPAKVSFHFI